MGILIQNGTVVTADRVEKADVLMEGSTIREVRAHIDPKGHTLVDATGLFVLPGGIDAHTHMDMPFGGTVSADDFLTGTRAAAIGGTTTIVDFAIQAKGTRMRDALDIWRAKAEGKACIDYGLHMIVTDLGSDNGKQGLHDMDDMVREGVASFKLFMAYPNVLMVDDGTIFKALQTDREKWRAGLYARRKWKRHRCDRATGACRGKDGADSPRADAADEGGGGGGAPLDRAC